MSATTGSPRAKSGCGVGCTVIFIAALGVGLLALIVGIVAGLKYALSEIGTGVPKEHGSPEILATPRVTPTEKPRATASQRARPANTTKQGTAANPSTGESKLEVRANRATFLVVSLNAKHFPPVYMGVVSPTGQPVVISGKHFWIQAMDPNALELWKNGQPVNSPDPDIVIEKY
jgi:hypothetical protein